MAALAKKRETRSRGNNLHGLIAKEKGRLARLQNQGTWRGRNNNVIIQYSRQYGQDRHRAEWSSKGCMVPTSDTGYAVFPGTYQKPDCIIARSGQCEIWEFKPDSPTGRDEGPRQDRRVREIGTEVLHRAARPMTPDSSHGGQAFLDELRKYCLDKDRSEIYSRR